MIFFFEHQHTRSQITCCLHAPISPHHPFILVAPSRSQSLHRLRPRRRDPPRSSWLVSVQESAAGSHLLSRLIEIFDCEGNSLTLPPIASLMTGKQLRDRIDSVTYLTSLEDSSDRNKKMIVEEGAIPPLLKLLKDGGSAEAQIAAANAISSLVDCVERTEAVAVGVPVIVKVLGSSSMKVRVSVAELVARMASEKVRDEKGRSAAGSAFFNAADATGGVDGAVKNASAAFARPRHRYSNSVDASSSGSRSVESSVFGEIIEAKKAMPPDKLAELWSIDPKRAKRLV